MTDIQLLVSNFAITLNGSPASADLAADVFEVLVEQSLHLSTVATVKITDAQLAWIDDTRFDPGTRLEIHASYSSDRRKIFDGEIVEIEPVFTEHSAPYLVLRAFDKLHRLSRGRYVRTFLNVNDGDVIKKIAQEVGLSAKVGQTRTLHPYLIQAGQSNLEFLQQRAAALGYLLYVEGDTLRCEPPKPSGASTELAMFVDLREFRPRLTTVDQINEVIVRGWDPKKKQAVIGQARNGNFRPKIGVSGSGGDIARRAYKMNAAYMVASGTVRDQGAAQTLAQAVADSHDARFVQAEGTAGGNPKIRAGAELKITGVGTRFSGSYFVTSSTHSFDLVNGYVTSFSVSGMQPSTLLSLLAPDEQPSAQAGAPAAAGYTLAVAIVTDNQDPENLGRVKLKYPALSDEHTSFWARVVALDGGNNRGFQFIPEVNDEVLVGFEMGDINSPFVLGGLWNGRDKPPLTASEAIQGGKVIKRTMHSRTGHYILFDDDDSGGGISIVDKKGNKIVLKAQDNSLTITTTGDVSLTTKGNLTMDVTGNAAFKAKGNMTLEATGNLELKATGQAELNGTAGAKVTSSAIVDVKGSMINLN